MKPSPCVSDQWAGGNLTWSENITSLCPGQGNFVKKKDVIIINFEKLVPGLF